MRNTEKDTTPEAVKKKFIVMYKFSDVEGDIIEAESLEEAREEAENTTAPKEETYCFGVDVREVEE